MVESMVALVLADHLMQHHAQCELFPRDFSFPASSQQQQGQQQLEGNKDPNLTGGEVTKKNDADVIPNRLGKLLDTP